MCHKANHYSSEAEMATLALIVFRKRWIHRTVETLEYSEGIVRKQVSFDLTVPRLTTLQSTQPEPVAIPVTYVEGGVLVGNLDVTDNLGSSLPVLCHGEHEWFESLLLKRLALNAIDNIPPKSEQLPEDGRKHLERLGELPRISRSDGENFLNDFYGSDKGSKELLKMRNNHSLREFCYLLTSHYLVLTEIKTQLGSRILVKYSYDARRPELRRSSAYARARSMFGVSPFSFRIPVPLARETESYHLKMAAPPGHFVFTQAFEVPILNGDQVGRKNIQSWKLAKLEEPLLEVGSQQVGEPYAHLYLGGSWKTPVPSGLHAHIVFHERPPGSLGVSIIMAILMSATFLFLRNNSSALIKSGHADMAGLLLALPGTIALWLRTIVRSMNSLTIPLTSNLTLSVCSLASYITAVMLSTAQADHYGGSAAFLPSIWLACALILLILAVRAAWSLLSNMRQLGATANLYLD